MRVLSIFDNSNKIRDAFRLKGHEALSLDIHPGHTSSKVDIVCNILDFDYKAFKKNHFNFLFIALPCQTYSIASAGHHFKKNIPVTSHAINSIIILIKIYQITQYFNCSFIIENPAGGLNNNIFFKLFFNLDVSRITLGSFGFPTQKKTDLFSNFNLLFPNSPMYRVNSRYQKQKLHNLTYRKKVTYPDQFIEALINNIISQL